MGWAMKRRTIQAVIFLLGITTLAGCYTPAPDYDYGLEKIKAGDAEKTAERNLQFEDDRIHVTWTPTYDRVGFTLENKTDSSISIIWNKASFVGPRGTSQGVMHQGVKYADRNKSLPPTNIPANARTEDIVVPANNVRWESPTEYSSGGWRVDPYLSREAEGDQTFRVILPIKYDDQTKRYSFYFNASQVDPEQSE
jgi:hypothetical protein